MGTSKEPSTSSPSKECTPDNSSTLELRPHSLWEIFFQSMPCQRVPSSLTVKANSVIEAHSPEPPAPQLSSLGTPMTAERLESDFHPVPERPSKDLAEPWLESSLVVKELTSHSSRLPTPGSRPEERERTGQELEVSQ